MAAGALHAVDLGYIAMNLMGISDMNLRIDAWIDNQLVIPFTKLMIASDCFQLAAGRYSGLGSEHVAKLSADIQNNKGRLQKLEINRG